MPPELLQKLGLKLKLLRRDPHYFLPTTQGSRHLLFGSDTAAMEQQFLEHFSKEDWHAHCRLNDEIKQIREDLAPAWLQVRICGFAPALNGDVDWRTASNSMILHACISHQTL
jgi:hypothetical protein